MRRVKRQWTVKETILLNLMTLDIKKDARTRLNL